jgi:hypothetical protein
MRVLDPMGELNVAPEGKPIRELETLSGKRVGLLWGMHAASVKFWPVFEEVVEAKFRPAETQKVYKKSTWNPSPPAEIEELAGKIDYAVIGVGA